MTYRVQSVGQYTRIMIFAPGDGVPELERTVFVWADEYRDPAPLILADE